MYVQLSHEELKALATKRASALTILVYSAISSHEWSQTDGYCFPSIARISKLLGDTYHRCSIHRAIQWLEKEGFLTRKKATSTQRFKLLFRNLKERAMEAVKEAVADSQQNQQGCNKERIMKRRNKQAYSKRQQRRKRGKSSKYQAPEHQRLQGDKTSALGWCCKAVFWLQNGCSLDDMPLKPSVGIAAIMEALKMDLHGFREHRPKILDLAVQLGIK